jgi:L-ribulokinase
VLEHSGHFMSPEMEMPKLMWLKKKLPGTWMNTGYLFDLADFMTWKATGSLARSRCTLTAKWNYLAHLKKGWQQGFS